MYIPPATTVNPVTFGIYKGTRVTHYGQCDYGVFKNYNIEIYSAWADKTKKKNFENLVHKLMYVSDMVRNFVKSKLIYFEIGGKIDYGTEKLTESERRSRVKHVIRSIGKGINT